MHDVDGKMDLLLVDGPYFVQLDPKRSVADDVAVAYLGRHGICGNTALIGSVEMQRDGCWRASVATDPLRDPFGFQAVALDMENRYDAIVALWQARGEAFVDSRVS